MNATELAMAMLEWGELQARADELAAAIRDEVLALGKTQTVGKVRATYSKGRTIYDYELRADEGMSSPDVRLAEDWYNARDENTKTVHVTDWKAVCEAMGAKDVPVKAQGEPSVTVKFV